MPSRQRRGRVLGGEGFQHLALVIYRPSEVVHLAIDLHLDLVEMPSPVVEGAHVADPLAADLGGERRLIARSLFEVPTSTALYHPAWLQAWRRANSRLG